MPCSCMHLATTRQDSRPRRVSLGKARDLSFSFLARNDRLPKRLRRESVQALQGFCRRLHASQRPNLPVIRPDRAGIWPLTRRWRLSNCYIEFVESKVGRHLGALARDTRTCQRPHPRQYLAGLSFGPSSAVMTQVLDESAKFQSSRKSSPAFESLVIHIDTDLSHASPAQHDAPAQKLLAKYRERFVNLSFECVHLSKVMRTKIVDWTSLLGEELADDSGDDTERLRRLFRSLPSATSRTDLLRLLVRSLLLDMALERSSSALLLGHSTTALASLALSQIAHGRGYVIPNHINDGPHTVCVYEKVPGFAKAREAFRTEIPIYYPLREVIGNEVRSYLDLMPSLRRLVPVHGAAFRSVVSNRDLSFDEIIISYFDDIEGPYSDIVANVVRTTGKLTKASGHDLCIMCGMIFDEQGDLRWAGELGDDAEDHNGWTKLCHGCKRTMQG